MSVSSPGETILEMLIERHITISEFADAMLIPIASAIRLLGGIEPLVEDIAKRLEFLFDVESNFWIIRENCYRYDRNRFNK